MQHCIMQHCIIERAGSMQDMPVNIMDIRDPEVSPKFLGTKNMQ